VTVSSEIAQIRADRAIQDIKKRSDDSLMHVGNYTTDAAGGSKRAVLAAEFAKYHSLSRGRELTQFFDPATGALVIVPESKDDESDGGVDD